MAGGAHLRIPAPHPLRVEARPVGVEAAATLRGVAGEAVPLGVAGDAGLEVLPCGHAVIEAERANELARVEAEQAIIEAEKANELIAAQRDLEIETARAVAATERAKADVAVQTALATLYAENPGFLQLQVVQANANALNTTDKIIFTPEGTVPTLVLPGPGIVPTVDTTQGATAQP